MVVLNSQAISCLVDQEAKDDTKSTRVDKIDSG